METVSDQPTAHEPNKGRDCSTHGPYIAHHIAGGIYEPCPSCLSESEVRVAEEPPALPVFDPKAARLAAMRIPPRFEHAVFETYDVDSSGQQAAFDMVKAFAVTFPQSLRLGRCLVMSGRPGTGKTHLGWSILRYLHAERSQFTGKLVGISDLFRTIKSSWDRKAKRTEAQEIASFVEPELLIIDEVGVQFDSATEANLLFEVINGRYQKLLPTVLISNLPPKDLRQVVGERVFDRLREGGGEVVAFDWPSHRGG